MKQLTVFEMEAISGGYSWDFSSIQSSITSLVSNGVEAVVSAATMGTLAAVFGTFVGGTQSGANGGVLGFGLFGNLRRDVCRLSRWCNPRRRMWSGLGMGRDHGNYRSWRTRFS